MSDNDSSIIELPLIEGDSSRYPRPVREALARIIGYLADKGRIVHSVPGSDGDSESTHIYLFLERAMKKHVERAARQGDSAPKTTKMHKVDFRRWINGGNVAKFETNPTLLTFIEAFISNHHDDEDGTLDTYLQELRRKVRDGEVADAPLSDTGRTTLDDLIKRAIHIEHEEAPSSIEANAQQTEEHALIEGGYKTRAALTKSLQSFLETADRILLFPPFSLQALSIHFCFAAFYAFLAMALVWGVGSFSDIGAVPILPSGSEVATAGRDFDGQGVADIRFFVLSVILVIVLVAVVGLIAAYTSITSTAARRLSDWILKWTGELSIGAVALSATALAVSGMDLRFAVLFFIIMSVAVTIAGRWDRRRLLAISFPFAFIFSIACIVLIGNVWGSVFAAGGVLPVLAFLSLLIGAAAQSRAGSLIASGVVLICSLLLAALNFFVFDGWFRIDPWDPGTVVIFLLLPMANGVWDYFSASITRRLSQWALRVTKTLDNQKAVLTYVLFVLVDVILAFATIILLYLSLFGALAAYNMVAFPDSEGVTLNAYFAGFQDSLFAERGLLVIIMLVTVLVPTLIHVHMVSRSMLRGGGLVGIASATGYVFAMLGSLVLLLNAARGILHFLVPA